jgi:hypothetical protein
MYFIFLDSESVSVALDNQHAMGMRRIVITSVTSLTVQFFLHYLKKSSYTQSYVLILSKTSKHFLF